MHDQVHVWRKEPPPQDERTYDPADSRWAYIEPDGTPEREMLERVTRSIVEDIVLISPEEADQNRDEVYQPIGQALAHGRTVYERE